MTARLLALFALTLTLGCVERPRVLGDQCDLNTGCSVPLVCGLGRCHNACVGTRDCDQGSTCAATNDGFGVCLLPDESSCISDSDCPETLVCRNEACVNACEENRDCPAGAKCEELDGRRACSEVPDTRCSRSSDCDEGLVCGNDSRCRLECVETRDCSAGERCDEGACMPEDAPRPDAGGDLDGGADDAGADDAGPLPDSGGADAGTDAGALAMDSGPDAAPPGFECVSASECGSSSIGDGATYACEGGRCAVTGCGAGFGDCDFAADNGCEQVLDTASHCGGCGLTCGGPGAECVAGACGAIVQLVGGNAHQCYRRESGAVYCWGNNDDGELGDGMPTSSTVTLPVQVVGLDAIDIAAGGRHSCAIERGGQVVCWGRNSRGQLGDGTIMERTAPTPCVGLPDPVTDPAVDVSAGDEHSCAVFASGELYCWGRQSDSRLGNVVNSSTGLPTPVQVNGAHLFDAVTAGQNSTCGLRRDGEVLCWGNRAEGQLGDGSTTGIRGAPSALVALLDGAISVLNSPRAGARNGCAERGDGTLACWGAGRGLGYGGTIARSYAVTPVGIETIGTYGVGDSATCATNPFGDLYCWGSAVPLPEFTGLTHVDLVAITDRIWALSEGRIYSFPLGGSRTLVEGF